MGLYKDVNTTPIPVQEPSLAELEILCCTGTELNRQVNQSQYTHNIYKYKCMYIVGTCTCIKSSVMYTNVQNYTYKLTPVESREVWLS